MMPLGPAAAAHFAQALRDHVTRCRMSGRPVPAEIEVLAELAETYCARLSHTGPHLAARPPESSEGRPVGTGLLTYEQAADWLAISVSQLEKLKGAGEVPYVLIGQRCVRFRRADLDAWAADKTTTEGEDR